MIAKYDGIIRQQVTELNVEISLLKGRLMNLKLTPDERTKIETSIKTLLDRRTKITANYKNQKIISINKAVENTLTKTAPYETKDLMLEYDVLARRCISKASH